MSALSPFDLKLASVSSTASGFMSTQVMSAPLLAQCMDMIPEPHPISRILSPPRTSRDSIRSWLSSDGGYTFSWSETDIDGSNLTPVHGRMRIYL